MFISLVYSHFHNVFSEECFDLIYRSTIHSHLTLEKNRKNYFNHENPNSAYQTYPFLQEADKTYARIKTEFDQWNLNDGEYQKLQQIVLILLALGNAEKPNREELETKVDLLTGEFDTLMCSGQKEIKIIHSLNSWISIIKKLEHKISAHFPDFSI